MENNINTQSMLPVGTTLQGGKYRIERYLSSGGFGNTYVATNTEFEEQVAIKEFFMRGVSERKGDSVTVSVSNKDNVTQFSAQKEKFRKEARRLRKLRNAHIVAVHDLFEENGTAYYEMDLIKGESLSERMKRTGQPLGEAEVLQILDQVLDALGVVHAQGLYHLDLKPANIMVDQTGRVLLIDFGASKQMSSGNGYSVSTSSALAFTPGFAPLEQTEQNMKSFGPWTDLYALGATLYKLLTGLTPPSASELMVSREPLVFPTPVSSKTQQLIAWMMKPAYIDRPQSVIAVRQFLSAPQPVVEEATQAVLPESVAEETEVMEKPRLKPEPELEPEPKPQLNPTSEKFADSEPERRSNKLSWGIGVGIAAAFVAAVIVSFLLLKGPSVVTDVTDNMEKVETSPLADETIYMEKEEVNTFPRADETITVNGISFKMIGVQGGTFTMGATSEQGSDAESDEKPAHQVTLSTFSIGQTEVTQELWQAVMGSNPSKFKGAKRPVEQVSWEDCQNFIRELNNLTGRRFRLPTEAEWEYAARGGNKGNGHKYVGSSAIDNVAWYYGNSGSETHDVATKRANELGLYDMSGNVWEWCQDWYGSYSSGSLTNPTVVLSSSDCVRRGGSWYDYARRCRVSCRSYDTPSYRDFNIGLRLAF